MKKIITILLAVMLAVFGFGCKGEQSQPNAVELKDLTGKVVAVIGKGSTPEFIFKHVLSKNDIAYEDGDTRVEGKVSITYAADSLSATALISSGKADYAVIAEPQVGGALNAVSREKVSFDLQTEYDKINNGGKKTGYPQAVVMVKNKVVTENGKTVSQIVGAMLGASEYAKADIERAKNLLKAAGAATLNTLTAESITRANVGLECITKESLETYFNIVFSSLDAIGGKLPDAAFYSNNQFNANETADKLKIFAPDGAPALSLVSLTERHDVKIVPPSTIASKMLTKEADVIILPSNAAVNLFNKGITDYTCVGSSSHGNLYVI